MAYKQVSYGSQGSDVTELQKLLNNNGYSVAVDGIYGSETQSAVKDYQKKNNLAVDGIVGTNTWSAITKAATNNEVSSSSGSSSGTASKPSAAEMMFENKEYTEGDAVKQAQAMLNEQLSGKPGAYQSQWQDQLNQIMDKILNREEFSYDLNGDALYQQYKDQYTAQGKMAMMDTMGQAAAMTGGYGNSYASTAGNQAYQSHLQQLNDVVPELYQMAYDKYNQEGQDMYDQYSLLGTQEEQDYGRYRDQMGDWETERDYLTDKYYTERDYDYGKWADDRDFSYGTFADDRSYAYQSERDQVADQQWQAEFDEAKRQYDQQYELSAAKSSSSSSSSGSSGSSGSKSSSGSSGSSYDNDGLSTAQIAALQKALGVDADGLWGSKSSKAAGGLSAAEAWEKYMGGDETPTVEDKTPNYGTIADNLNTYIKNGASKSEIGNYLRSAYKAGYINQDQYESLKEGYIPVGLTY